MGSKQIGMGLYEFLIESELQHYYNAIKNDLKVQSVSQLKYVTDDDLNQIGMARPEIRRLKKFFQKHYPQTYLAKMKKKLLYRRDDAISVASLSSYAPNAPGRTDRSVAPGRHIIQAESIVIHKTLGSGEFGTVQQGVWTSDDGQRTQVAIKCLSQERMENNPVEFLKEAAIMHNVDHEHIVRLYGVVLDTSALMLVTELAPLRSLLECLKEPSMRRNLSVLTLYDFAVQICDGMQYLESKRLIHRDLAARNILVFSRSKVKISDFGLSRALGVGKDYYQTNFNVNLKLPIAWCAPECINFLRFTSSSDVWAYGVTLWEMFSYGFQPWAALTGQQILEAIDEPNYQRLERPECCPNEIYCQIMLKCWQHDPLTRPSFAQLSNLILECKPEQLQAIRESDPKPRRDFLIYDVGDIITVLEKKPQQSSDDVILWKGVLKDGKTGLFQAVNTITYLGSSLPSVKPSQSPFHRNDSRSSSMRKGRISADMISGPQGDLKHTGHVGPDGQFFGDITFLGSKCWVPRQVVPPYKPETSEPSGSSGRAVLQNSSRSMKESTTSENSSDTVPLLATASFINDEGSNKGSTSSSSGLKRKPITVSIPGISYNTGQDHEYHEISDEENEIMQAMGSCMDSTVGLSNPALSSKSQSPLDSPRFDKSFDLETGPSLVDEVFGALQQDTHGHPDEAHNVKNELREMARSKKKFASVKPISSSDRRTLDHAIAIANELATRSMLDLDRSGKHPSFDDISSPRTPNSPSHRSKFSFILGSGKNDRERRNYSQEAASIPDIQSTLTDEAKEAYNSLVEKPSMNALGFLTPSFENKSMSFHFPEKCSSLSKKSDFFQPEPINGPQSLTEISPKANSSVDPACNVTSFPGKSHSRSLSKSEAEDLASPISLFPSQQDNEYNEEDVEEEEVDGNPLRLLRQNKQAMLTNVLPLPPRKGTGHSAPNVRHQRKHPLLIPTRISSLTSSSIANSNTVSDLKNNESNSSTKASPPPPPPKPLRQSLISESSKKGAGEKFEKETSPSNSLAQKDNGTPSDIEMSKDPEAYFKDRRSVSSIANTINSESKQSSMDSILLYENVLEGNCSSDNDNVPSGNDVASTNTSSTVNSEDCHSQKDVPTILPSAATTTTNSNNNIKLSSSESSYASFSSSTSNNRFKASSIAGSSSSSRVAPIASDHFGTAGAFKTDEYHPSKVTEKSHSRQSSISLGESASVQSSSVEPVPKPRTLGVNNVKIKTLQRILGPSASEEDCGWALDATDSDAAHAVKLLRLKCLLPETLITSDASNLVSVLEMSHWDVARASDFLLSNNSSTAHRGSSIREKLMRHSLNSGSFSNYDSVVSNTSPDTMNNNSTSDISENTGGGTGRRSYIRPTHV